MQAVSGHSAIRLRAIQHHVTDEQYGLAALRLDMAEEYDSGIRSRKEPTAEELRNHFSVLQVRDGARKHNGRQAYAVQSARTSPRASDIA